MVAKKPARHPGKGINRDGSQRGGRGKTWKPTQAERETIQRWGAYLSEAEIAKRLGVSRNTLRKHCKDLLELGRIEAKADVAQSLIMMATGRQEVIETDKRGRQRRKLVSVAPNFQAGKFYLMAQCGWRPYDPPNKNQVDPPDTQKQMRMLRTALAEIEDATGVAPDTDGSD